MQGVCRLSITSRPSHPGITQRRTDAVASGLLVHHQHRDVPPHEGVPVPLQLGHHRPTAAPAIEGQVAEVGPGRKKVTVGEDGVGLAEAGVDEVPDLSNEKKETIALKIEQTHSTRALP